MHFTHKNIVLIVVAILIVSGAFAFAEYRNSQSKKVVYDSPIVADTERIPLDLQNTDTDNDGLKDWEEALLGTDAAKADTDGDGTNDGTEAKANRNPLIKGPDDKASDIAKTAIAPAPLTQTDKFARDFFAKYLELNQTGLANDKESQTALIGQVLKNGIVIETPKTYAQTDILTSPDNSKEAIKNYGNRVGKILSESPIKSKDEAYIAKQSFDNEDPELLKQIDPIIATYKKILSGLLKVTVPSELVGAHINLVNGVSAFVFVAESYRKSDVDAIKGVQAVKQHLVAGKTLSDALQQIRTFLLTAGIEYTPSEGGYLFTKTK